MGAVRKALAVEEIAGAAFLGVTASARGLAWRDRLDAAAAMTAIAICQRHGLPELLGRVLAARGIGIDEVPVALDPSLKALMPDPSTVQDMDKGAARLADAIEKGEAIAVFGDYDVDGASSAALMQRFLAAHGRKARIYIPDRMTEGYGPSAEAIAALAGEGARLIVTVDCGTTGVAPLAAAAPLGAEVIVVDHHQADERLPEVAAVINPNRQDDLSGLGHLCAAGVTFMVLVATSRELRRRGFYGARARRRRTCSISSTSSRSQPCATWCPSRASTAPSSPRACRSCASAATSASRRWPTPPASPCRRRPITWASCWARASTPADASATRASARGCSPPPTRSTPPASPSSSTGSTASARRSRPASSRRRSPAPRPCWRRTPTCPCCCWRARAGTRAWWASSPAGSPTASSAPPASSPGARPARALARCAPSTASTSARRCAPR